MQGASQSRASGPSTAISAPTPRWNAKIIERIKQSFKSLRGRKQPRRTADAGVVSRPSESGDKVSAATKTMANLPTTQTTQAPATKTRRLRFQSPVVWDKDAPWSPADVTIHQADRDNGPGYPMDEKDSHTTTQSSTDNLNDPPPMLQRHDEGLDDIDRSRPVCRHRCQVCCRRMSTFGRFMQAARRHNTWPLAFPRSRSFGGQTAPGGDLSCMDPAGWSLQQRAKDTLNWLQRRVMRQPERNNTRPASDVSIDLPEPVRSAASSNRSSLLRPSDYYAALPQHGVPRHRSSNLYGRLVGESDRESLATTPCDGPVFSAADSNSTARTETETDHV